MTQRKQLGPMMLLNIVFMVSVGGSIFLQKARVTGSILSLAKKDIQIYSELKYDLINQLHQIYWFLKIQIVQMWQLIILLPQRVCLEQQGCCFTRKFAIG